MSATLNGRTVTRCTVSIPAWGVWWADVECASADVLTGAVTLVLEDLTLRGTIITGGAYEARTRYRIAGGAGGWGKTIAAKSDANDLGIKYSNVLTDAANACGETMGPIPTGTTGPAFVRAQGPASSVLNELFPRGWYVDEAGVTQIGKRASRVYTGSATRTRPIDQAAGTIELAAPSLLPLLPGAVVDGLEAVDVEHVLEAGKVRTTIWGKQAGRDGDPIAAKLARIVERVTEHTRYFAPWEYRVVSREGERWNLQSVRASSGMPDLKNVRIRPGVAGLRARLKLGSLVLVSFVNGDPSRPAITACDDYDSPGFIPDEIFVQAGATGSNAGVTEHATSAEALIAAVQQVLASVGPIIGGGFGSAVTALSIAPAFDALVPLIAGRTLAATTKAAIATALAAKSADTGGDSPGLGWPRVRGG